MKIKSVLFIILSVMLVLTSVSCTQTSANESTELDLTSANAFDEVVSASSASASLVTRDDLMAVIAKADAAYGKYSSIRVSEDKVYPVNTAAGALTVEYVENLTYENYKTDYDAFMDYRVGHYKLVMALLKEAFPNNFFSGDALAGDAAMILDPANSGYDTVGYAVGGMLYGEDVGPVVYMGGGNLYLCDTATGDYEIIYPTADITKITEMFNDLAFYVPPIPTVEELEAMHTSVAE